ncbi:MAG TPA: hypothetical protein PKB14_01255 [Rubrivivax sp.]|nr:hypothetical protein [Rubrivivax sp.]
MDAQTLFLDLYKVNIGLQLGISRLLQEGGHGWLEAARQFSADGMAETGEQIDKLRRAADWQALTTLPSEVFGRLLQGQSSEAQTLTKLAVRSQIDFTNGLQQALASWREGVSDAFGGSAEARSFLDVFKQGAQPWVAAMTAAPGKGRN